LPGSFIGLCAAVFFQKVEVDVVAGQVFEGVRGRFGVLADQRCQLGVLDDDGVDRQSGLETDFIQGAQIGWVGDGNRQAITPPC